MIILSTWTLRVGLQEMTVSVVRGVEVGASDFMFTVCDLHKGSTELLLQQQGGCKWPIVRAICRAQHPAFGPPLSGFRAFGSKTLTALRALKPKSLINTLNPCTQHVSDAKPRA